MSLESLGVSFGTDKAQTGLLQYYESKMAAFQHMNINILEIGVFFGSSIKMWRCYFPTAHIYGLDAFEGKQGNGQTFKGARTFYDEVMIDKKLNRVTLITCDQSNRDDLEKVRDEFLLNKIEFQFIIDDGSHLMKDQQQTLGIFAKCMAKGGMYFMEDWGSSLDCYPDVRPDLSNSTLTMMLLFNRTKQFESEYCTSEEKDTLQRRLQHAIDIWHCKNSGTAMLKFL